MAQHTKSPSNTSKPRRVQEVLLTLGALAGLASIVFFVAGLAFNITPLIFKSGSMSPTIDTGALAFARTVPASEVQAGDIVSVYDSKGRESPIASKRSSSKATTLPSHNCVVTQIRSPIPIPTSSPKPTESSSV